MPQTDISSLDRWKGLSEAQWADWIDAALAGRIVNPELPVDRGGTVEGALDSFFSSLPSPLRDAFRVGLRHCLEGSPVRDALSAAHLGGILSLIESCTPVGAAPILEGYLNDDFTCGFSDDNGQTLRYYLVRARFAYPVTKESPFVQYLRDHGSRETFFFNTLVCDRACRWPITATAESAFQLAVAKWDSVEAHLASSALLAAAEALLERVTAKRVAELVSASEAPKPTKDLLIHDINKAFAAAKKRRDPKPAAPLSQTKQHPSARRAQEREPLLPGQMLAEPI